MRAEAHLTYLRPDTRTTRIVKAALGFVVCGAAAAPGAAQTQWKPDRDDEHERKMLTALGMAS